MADWLIGAAKVLVAVFTVLQLSALLLWVERKGSALIQNRIGANRASVFGIMPFNLGLTNTLLADPIKLFTKEELKILELGVSNAAYHYLGSAKILGQIGKAFADALAGMN